MTALRARAADIALFAAILLGPAFVGNSLRYYRTPSLAYLGVVGTGLVAVALALMQRRILHLEKLVSSRSAASTGRVGEHEDVAK